MKPRTETEAVAAGLEAGEDVKNRAEKRVEVGKGGCEIGKWRSFSHLETVFSHLFPRFSTQVVDFPRMTVVSIFWGGTQNSRISGRGMEMKAKRSLEVLPDGHCGEAELI